MFEKNVLNMNDNSNSIVARKKLYCVGFTDEELKHFEIHFETPHVFSEVIVNLDYLLVAAIWNS